MGLHGRSELVYMLNTSDSRVSTHKAPLSFCEWFVFPTKILSTAEKSSCFLIGVAVRLCQRMYAISHLVAQHNQIQ